MSDFQASKAFVLDLYRALDRAPAAACAEVLSHFTTDDWLWRGMHPFNEQRGPEAVARVFWEPCKRAFMPLQRRQNIFFAGRNFMDDYRTEWVCSMGHLLGLFDAPWLGIQPTRKMSFLRYAEFHRIEGDRIAETALFVDVMSVMHQAGLRVFPESTGATVITPGPQTQDGLLFDPHPEEEGRATMALIQRMIDRLIATGVRTLKEDLELDWHDDMLWWGPAGIGAAYTHERYIEQHCRPFEDGLEFLTHHGHVLEFAEGSYGGFFGYPTMRMKSKGGYMGLTSAGDVEAEMRIVDLYRREGDKLAENWIFIDNLHFLQQLGVDLLERQERLSGLPPAG
ncbi:MAG: nuclear transport factor 2 family protein [Defluviicoccus sp.]|nr:nuclear transport factor 2 family protein [Defluviicoccus sp.]